MNCVKKVKQRNREMHSRGFFYPTIRPGECGIVTLWAPSIIVERQGMKRERTRSPDVYCNVTDVSKG